MKSDTGMAADAMREILERINGLDICTERKREDKYCEVVFHAKDLRCWNSLFTELIGPASKPAKAKPTEEQTCMTSKYGGIYQGQTLFSREYDDGTIIAMFWPWQDAGYTTLKVAFIEGA